MIHHHMIQHAPSSPTATPSSSSSLGWHCLPSTNRQNAQTGSLFKEGKECSKPSSDQNDLKHLCIINTLEALIQTNSLLLVTDSAFSAIQLCLPQKKASYGSPVLHLKVPFVPSRKRCRKRKQKGKAELQCVLLMFYFTSSAIHLCK